MINPIDLGRDVGWEFAKQLLTEAPQIKKVIGVLPGRFQPFHRGHKSLYDALARVVGKGNTYIATSGKTEPGRSPFSFSEKQKIISKMFGIPRSKIVRTRNPYTPTEILKKFDPETTAVVTVFSEKDAGRLASGKYYQPYKRGMEMQGYKDEGYYIEPPVYSLSVDGQNISGTALRNFFGDPSKSRKEKQKMMKKVYGKVDSRILDLLINKLGGKNEGLSEAMISRVLIRDFRNRQKMRKMMYEGGAAGHMAHPFDDMNLTFGDLKKMVELGLEGSLDVEKPVTEKLDGQNISVSYKDGNVLFARNKSHMKNQGANALSVSGIKRMFSGRGELQDAFGKAAEDLESGISRLSSRQQEAVFANGKKWMSMEILYPATQNTIPYGRKMLVFHHIMEVDDKGSVVNVEKGGGRMLAGMLRQINQNIQKTFEFSGPVVVKLPKSENFGMRKGHYTGQITRLQNQFNLSDSDPVMMWHQAWWMDFISEKAQKMRYGIPNNVLMGLVKRWAFLESGAYSIRDIKRDIKDEDFLNWVLSYDKGNKERQFKKNISRFETIFLRLGAEILSNAIGLLSVSPDSSAQSIQNDIKKAVKELRRAKNPKKISRFKENLKKLQRIGINRIVPSEGIVFMYKGKLYKLTGTFAPVNQLLGVLRY